MDDRNFRRELHTLKQQVNELSPKYKPIPRHMASNTAPERLQDDPFAAQLDDVNAQMTSMEDTMRELKRRLERPLEAAKDSSNAFNADNVSAQRHLSLPSGPIFWQLFNSLRTDLRTIDGRVAALEQSVSDLEDRVDGLDPNQFTPGSSAATSEVGYTQAAQEGYVNSNNNVVDHRPCALPEPYKDMNGSQGCLPIPAEQPCWQQPYLPTHMQRPLVYPNILQPQSELPMFHYEQVRPYYEDSLRSETATATSTINHLHQQNDAIQGRINKIDRENEIMLQAIQNLTQRLDRPRQVEKIQVQAELPSRSWPKPFETPEVRFRDREIDRMDELLRATQERLRLTEESMAQKDASIAQLRVERDDQRARESAERTYQLREQLAQVCDTLDARNTEVSDLRYQIEQRDDALQRWQESFSRVDEEVTSYKHAYYDSMVRADRDIQKLSSDHEEETTKLKDFCEQKDVVIQRQEDVIARGANLLEQRDHELEDMARQLRAAEDDRKHARRTQDRLSRLLTERDGEIEQLRRKTNATGSEHRQNKAAGPTVSDRNITWDDPLPVPDNQSWTSFPLPQRTDDDRNDSSKREPMYVPASQESRPWVQVGSSPLQFQKMPSGERRGHREDDPGLAEDSFDQTSLRSNTNKKRTKRQRRYSHRQYPELSKQPESPRVETWPWRAETREGLGSAPSEQGRKADDDITGSYWAPLPAPVTARRMASDANLHSRTYDSGRSRLSKYHSMQELPKGRLQAYVESEPESGGEIGKEV